MKKFTRLSHLSDVSDKYDLFLFDLCGVLHNGEVIFPDAASVINSLKAQNKLIVFLSNSPRTPKMVADFLATGGICSYDLLTTSLEYFKHYAHLNPEFIANKRFFNFGNTQYDFGRVEINLTNNIEKADYIIISLFKEALDTALSDDEVSVMKKAIDIGITGICVNPDLRAPCGETLRYTPGYFAKEYEKLGGKVIYFGKPHLPIYEFALNDLMNNNNILKNKVLIIGDSLLTDIKGANDFGIDSLLVYARGVHKNEDFQDHQAIERLFTKHDSFPDYIAEVV